MSDFVDAYRSWTKDRMKLSAQEELGTADPDEWTANDDAAVELLKQAADALADGRCLDCGNAFTDSIAGDDALAAVLPDMKYGDAGNGFCLMCDEGRQAIAEEAAREVDDDDDD